MKTAFICPFKLERLTGTPIRARATIEAVSAFTEGHAITATGGFVLFTSKTVKELARIRPDVIHGFSTLSVLPLLVYKLFFRSKVQFIYEMHGWSWYETEGTLMWPKRVALLLLDTIGFKVATRVIAMSHSERDFLAHKFGHADKIEVIWGPVDFPISFENQGPKTELVVGYQGNASWWQGLDILLNAAKQLESKKDIRFRLAGFDHSDKTKFPSAPNVTYIGRFERKDVSKLIKQCDVMVSPRLASQVSDLQYPQKLSEYLAAGRPVIAFDTSDQKPVIEKAKAGYIVENPNSQDLARAIEKFANTPAEKRAELGQNAAVFAEKNLSMNVFRTKLKILYDTLG